MGRPLTGLRPCYRTDKKTSYCWVFLPMTVTPGFPPVRLAYTVRSINATLTSSPKNGPLDRFFTAGLLSGGHAKCVSRPESRFILRRSAEVLTSSPKNGPLDRFFTGINNKGKALAFPLLFMPVTGLEPAPYC